MVHIHVHIHVLCIFSASTHIFHSEDDTLPALTQALIPVASQGCTVGDLQSHPVCVIQNLAYGRSCTTGLPMKLGTAATCVVFVKQEDSRPIYFDGLYMFISPIDEHQPNSITWAFQFSEVQIGSLNDEVKHLQKLMSHVHAIHLSIAVLLRVFAGLREARIAEIVQVFSRCKNLPVLQCPSSVVQYTRKSSNCIQ